ncbi:SH3 domain protein [Talaromyces proteolyticus]|uniref:SH3 domain protein n=1 Tax=Talaromyces proteolyticus TaxID=1131652 RepID=A0AAD4KJT4_9EURO|nr:SH3 domain protein [Talaromyces proteolyticus]KAH8690121.1 SH3 domain protein [Talaromyces proteolyticus]
MATTGAQPGASTPGLGELEKELVCSICTELLYQPLTLLDCLHTFCGSCLKEWFSWQAVRPRTSSSAPRFTCPSCRAGVRATRPNATVTSLLDMVLKVNPGHARSAQDKEEIAKKYKPGDSVLVSPPNASESDEEDRRLIENVRELSLSEVSASHRRRASSSQAGDTFHRRQARSADNRDRSDDERRGRHDNDPTTRRQAQHHVARTAASTGTTIGSATDPARRIEHQSSLRSLLSASDVGDTTQEEIVRLIMEEGLLDGIDLRGLDQAQEEELSDGLVQIFLSRHPERSHPQRRSSDQTERPAPSSQHRRSRSHTTQSSRSPSAVPTESGRRPPVSRPHLLEATETPLRHQRRASDETRRRRTSPTPVAAASTSETALRPATRSSSDMTNQRSSAPRSQPRTRESSATSISRRATEPEGRASELWLTGTRESPQSQTGRQILGSLETNSPTVSTPTDRTPSASNAALPGVSTNDTPSPSTSLPNLPASVRRPATSRPAPPRQHPVRVPSTHYTEPSLSCERCGISDIQYKLHKRCHKCKNGNFHVCLHCYRVGSGCPYYNTVSSTREEVYKDQHHPANRSPEEQPHVLNSQKYRKPKESSLRGTSDWKQITNENPASRLEDGMFCDICQSATNNCFWQCSECNEGEWGYCRRCVNQGRCCSHPLLPVRRILSTEAATSPTEATPTGLISVPPSLSSPESTAYQVLSFSTECDICKYPIAPSSTRFHCLKCNEGNYDVCTNCYLKLVASGKISKENGHNGWRRCLNSHRMIVVGYEDHEKGQRRRVVRDIVGGYTLKEETPQVSSRTDSSNSVASPDLGNGDWSWKEGNTKRKKASRARTSHAGTSSPTTDSGSPTTTQSSGRRVTGSVFPPDGGYGLVLRAEWPYFAEENCTDELSFPKGAEISEAENINDEWYWGYYAGHTGLFPGNYCTPVREVTQ